MSEAAREKSSRADRAWIRDLRPGIDVKETYAVSAKDLRQRRNGGPFLTMRLSDRTGTVDALAWERVELFHRACSVGDVVRVHGQVQRYNQRLQIVVRELDRVASSDVDETLYVRAADADPDLLWQRLSEAIESVGDPSLRQLLFRIFSDPEVGERFKLGPAARSLHHAYRSGLIEHTLSMVKAGAALAEAYGADRSLVVAGCLLHDLGKIWELEAGASIEYTDDGRLLGHLPMVALYVDRKIAELEAFSPELRRQLLHILLSHHGEYAHGSPRRPKTPEALLVSAVDDLDSKMAAMHEAIAAGGDTGEAWTAFSPILERFVYRRPPATEDE